VLKPPNLCDIAQLHCKIKPKLDITVGLSFTHTISFIITEILHQKLIITFN